MSAPATAPKSRAPAERSPKTRNATAPATAQVPASGIATAAETESLSKAASGPKMSGDRTKAAPGVPRAGGGGTRDFAARGVRPTCFSTFSTACPRRARLCSTLALPPWPSRPPAIFRRGSGATDRPSPTCQVVQHAQVGPRSSGARVGTIFSCCTRCTTWPGCEPGSTRGAQRADEIRRRRRRRVREQSQPGRCRPRRRPPWCGGKDAHHRRRRLSTNGSASAQGSASSQVPTICVRPTGRRALVELRRPHEAREVRRRDIRQHAGHRSRDRPARHPFRHARRIAHPNNQRRPPVSMEVRHPSPWSSP